MKKSNLFIFIITSIILYSFPLSLTLNYNVPLFSLSKAIKSGMGGTATIPFYKGDNFSFNISLSYNQFQAKNFDAIYLNLVEFSPTLQYHILQTFHFNLDHEIMIDILSQNIKEGDNEFGKLFISLSTAILFEYFYTEKLHLLIKGGFTLTDAIYVFYVKTGFVIDL